MELRHDDTLAEQFGSIMAGLLNSLPAAIGNEPGDGRTQIEVLDAEIRRAAGESFVEDF